MRRPAVLHFPVLGDADPGSDETRVSPEPGSPALTGANPARLDVGRLLNGRLLLVQQPGEGGMGRVF